MMSMHECILYNRTKRQHQQCKYWRDLWRFFLINYYSDLGSITPNNYRSGF